MKPLLYSIVIAITIYLAWNLKGKFTGKIAGLVVGGFWLTWTLGLSAVFVGYALGGELLFVQLAVIIVVFYLSFKMWKNKNLINDLKNNLDKIDNQNFSSKINDISNKQIKVLSTPKEHRKFLLKTLNQANKTIIIFSGWLTDYSVNDEFRTKVKSCLNRGVDIIIAWGYKKSGSISSEQKNAGEKSIKELQEWTSLNKTKGTLETFYFTNHSKILICDTQYAVMGSFNWLSNSGGSTNEERSWIVYNKDFIQDEIVEIMKNLYDPKKSLSRRQLLKNFVPFSRY
ncbi:phospholipase D-like domain-containing protein [Candidatus Pelagibacter ubique]|jgi:phosphatidylserine/phosphatidylglycerophosphate/cardiolipin synthase-like enzyme|nr:phospholipase D-like domain-containing protein [Candidatus Pelagibacter ubique]MDC1054812.1 phospholipase D-like domain-containing protein [Candidatus Pelagibacter ubique]